MLYNTNAATASTWSDMLKEVPALQRISGSGNAKVDNFNELELDVFSRLLDNQNEGLPIHILPEQQWQLDTHAGLDSIEMWQKLQVLTNGDKRLSLVAAAYILDTISARMPYPDHKESARELSKLRSTYKQAVSYGITSVANKTQQIILEIENKFDIYARRYCDETKYWLSHAVDIAYAAITANLTAADGWSDMPGVHQSKSLADKVKATQAYSSTRCQQILMQLGRMSSVLGKARRTAKKQKTGIEYGSDIPNLLAEEWLKEDDQFLLEFAEGKLAQHSTGKQALGKGPIVVLLDQSGSMDNDASLLDDQKYDIWAKAFTLFIAKLAHREKRDIFCITFDDRVLKQLDLKAATAEEVGKLLNFVPYGSTDWTVAIDKAVEIIKSKSHSNKFKTADILLITDGTQVIKSGYRQQLTQLKSSLNFKIQGILIHKPIKPEHEQHARSPIKLLSAVADTQVHISNLTDETKLTDTINSL